MENKIKVFHNPRCSKSRNALSLLEEKDLSFDVVEYLKSSPSKADIIEILKKLKMEAKDLVRKGEPDFKDNFKGQELTESEWVDAMVEFPKLIERPIVILGNKAVVARPTEKINELFD